MLVKLRGEEVQEYFSSSLNGSKEDTWSNNSLAPSSSNENGTQLHRQHCTHAVMPGITVKQIEILVSELCHSIFFNPRVSTVTRFDRRLDSARQQATSYSVPQAILCLAQHLLRNACVVYFSALHCSVLPTTKRSLGPWDFPQQKQNPPNNPS